MGIAVTVIWRNSKVKKIYQKKTKYRQRIIFIVNVPECDISTLVWWTDTRNHSRTFFVCGYNGCDFGGIENRKSKLRWDIAIVTWKKFFGALSKENVQVMFRCTDFRSFWRRSRCSRDLGVFGRWKIDEDRISGVQGKCDTDLKDIVPEGLNWEHLGKIIKRASRKRQRRNWQQWHLNEETYDCASSLRNQKCTAEPFIVRCSEWCFVLQKWSQTEPGELRTAVISGIPGELVGILTVAVERFGRCKANIKIIIEKEALHKYSGKLKNRRQWKITKFLDPGRRRRVELAWEAIWREVYRKIY